MSARPGGLVQRGDLHGPGERYLEVRRRRRRRQGLLRPVRCGVNDEIWESQPSSSGMVVAAGAEGGLGRCGWNGGVTSRSDPVVRPVTCIFNPTWLIDIGLSGRYRPMPQLPLVCHKQIGYYTVICLYQIITCRNLFSSLEAHHSRRVPNNGGPFKLSLIAQSVRTYKAALTGSLSGQSTLDQDIDRFGLQLVCFMYRCFAESRARQLPRHRHAPNRCIDAESPHLSLPARPAPRHPQEQTGLTRI